MDNSFWIGTHLKDFLFKGFTISSLLGLLATCLGVACLAILYEGGRIYKLTLKSQAPILPDYEGDTVHNYDTHPPLASFNGNQSSRIKKKSRIAMAAMYALLCVGHDLMGYILMLSVMTMNFGIAFAIWFGAGIGYFTFAASISAAVSAKSSSHCANGRGRERNLESSSDDHTAALECQSEGIVGEEGALGAGVTGQQPVNVSCEDETGLQEESPIGYDLSQGNVVISQALIHNEPSWQEK